MNHTAIVFHDKHKRYFRCAFVRGCNTTREFAMHSGQAMQDGGASIALSDRVNLQTLEAIKAEVDFRISQLGK